jgi:PAS domain-containing protein
MIHPEDMPHVREVFGTTSAREKGLFATEFRLRSTSGDWRWVLSRGKAVHWDEQGQPNPDHRFGYRYRGTQRVQEEMRRSEARFRSLFAMGPVRLSVRPMTVVFWL